MHRVVVQLEIAHEHLAVHHVAEQLVVLVAAVGDEPHVALGALDVGAAREHRHHARHIAVADVVLLAGRAKHDAVVIVGGCRGQHHVGVVDIGTVFSLG